jgi:hypothetical protein
MLEAASDVHRTKIRRRYEDLLLKFYVTARLSPSGAGAPLRSACLARCLPSERRVAYSMPYARARLSPSAARSACLARCLPSESRVPYSMPYARARHSLPTRKSYILPPPVCFARFPRRKAARGESSLRCSNAVQVPVRKRTMN